MKSRSIFHQLGPRMFQLPVGCREPDLDWMGDLEQIIDVPVRLGGRFKVMTKASTETARTQCTADISLEPRHNVKSSQAADVQAFHP